MDNKIKHTVQSYIEWTQVYFTQNYIFSLKILV